MPGVPCAVGVLAVAGAAPGPGVPAAVLAAPGVSIELATAAVGDAVPATVDAPGDPTGRVPSARGGGAIVVGRTVGTAPEPMAAGCGVGVGASGLSSTLPNASSA